MAARDFERAPDQFDLKSIHFIIKRYAARQVDLRGYLLPADLRSHAVGVEDFFAQVLALDSIAARNYHCALDDVFKLAHVAGPVMRLKRRQDFGADLI
jgi:hypothetical protein